MIWTILSLTTISAASYGMLVLLGNLQAEKWSVSRCILLPPKDKFQGRTITPSVVFLVLKDVAGWNAVLGRRVESQQGEWRVDGLICNLMWEEQDRKLVYSFRDEFGNVAIQWTFTFFERDAHPFPAHIPIPASLETGGCFCQLKEEGFAKKPLQRLWRWYRGAETGVDDALWNLTVYLRGQAALPIFVNDGTKKIR